MSSEASELQRRFISASVASGVISVIFNPLDVVRVRLQTQNEQYLKGTFAGIGKIFKNEGFFGLYRGFSVTLFISIPSTSLYIVGYEYLNEKFSEINSFQKISPFLSGSLARSFAACFVSPFELLRTRVQQSNRDSFGGIVKGIKSDCHFNGIRILWRGLVPTLWRDVPFSGFYWYGYEYLKKNVFQFNPESRGFFSGLILPSMISGGVSGMIAAFITTPFDLLKTRRQMKDVGINNHGTLKLLKTLYTGRGLKSLFIGGIPRILKIGPSCAITITIYEAGKFLYI
jgi:solute carrier family 25 protein 39/40